MGGNNSEVATSSSTKGVQGLIFTTTQKVAFWVKLIVCFASSCSDVNTVLSGGGRGDVEGKAQKSQFMLGEFLRGTLSRTATPGGTHSGAKVSLKWN